MDQAEAEGYARAWIAAWNAHDVEAVLAHFADDVTFSSPLVATIAGEPSGTLHGKDALRAYWQEGLRRIPDLRFELDAVHVGVDAVLVVYRNQAGRACSELAEFGPGRSVVRGVALYGPAGG